MDEKLKKREMELELTSIEEEIETKKATIAEKKAIEAEMKAKHGLNWKKVLGMAGGIKMDSEKMHTLFSMNPELKELNRPRPRVGWRG